MCFWKYYKIYGLDQLYACFKQGIFDSSAKKTKLVIVLLLININKIGTEIYCINYFHQIIIDNYLLSIINIKYNKIVTNIILL